MTGMSCRCKVPKSRAGSDTSRLRTANNRQEIIVVVTGSTGDIMNLLYRDIRFILQAKSLLEEGGHEFREYMEEVPAPFGGAWRTNANHLFRRRGGRTSMASEHIL